MRFSKWRELAPKNIVHVGAHACQEARVYERAGATRVLWIEANPIVVNRCAGHLGPIHTLVQGVVSYAPGMVVDFYTTNNEQSSSMLKMGTHSQLHPEVEVTGRRRLTTTTVDILCESHGIVPDCMTLDVQGAELMALMGSPRQLFEGGLRHIYTEVNFEHVYQDCVLHDQLVGFLASFGFTQTHISHSNKGWGNALFSRS